MAGNGRFIGTINPAAAAFSIRRVTNHEVKGFGIDKIFYVAGVSLNNMKPMFKPIFTNIVSGKDGKIMLEFQPDQLGFRIKPGQNQTNDAAAAPEIKHSARPSEPAKMGGKDGINRKAVPVPVLAAEQIAIIKAVFGKRPVTVQRLLSCHGVETSLFFLPKSDE
jgi:hypothetical protein